MFIVHCWAGRVTDSDNTGGCGVYGGRENCVPTCSSKILGGRSHLNGLHVPVSVIIIKSILVMWHVRLVTGSMWLWICGNMKLYEHSNEPLSSIEDWEILDQLSDG